MAGRTRANPKGAAKESPSTKPAAGWRNVKAEKPSPAKAKAPPTPRKAPVTRSSPRNGGAVETEVEVDHDHDEEELSKTDKKSTAAAARKSKTAKTKSDTDSTKPADKPTSNHVTVTSPAPPAAAAQQSRKDMEREKRKDSAVVKLGSSIVCAMPEADMTTFLERLSSFLSPTDVKSHLARATSVKWDSIAFGSYSGEQLRAAWIFLRSCTRSYRIMAELVNEVKLTYSNTQFKYKILEALPGFPQSKRFLSTFHLYLKDKWDRRTQQEKDQWPTWLIFQAEYKKGFDTLSDAEKKHWEQVTADARAEHDAQVEAYFTEHPEFAAFKEIYDGIKAEELEPKKKKKGGGSKSSNAPRVPRIKKLKESTEADFPDAPTQPPNPQALYINSRLVKQNLDPQELDEDDLKKHKLRFSEEWNGLPDNKKKKWINKCIRRCEAYREAVQEFEATHPGYRPQVFKLVHKVGRAEIEMWAKTRGMPERPPFTVTEKLQKELLEQDEGNKKLTTAQLKDKADKMLKDMAVNDRELYKVNFKQGVLMYRKEIAEFYYGIQDVAKPVIYSLIPKKFREGLRLPGEVKIEPEDNESTSGGERAEPKSLVPGPRPKTPSPVRAPTPVPSPAPKASKSKAKPKLAPAPSSQTQHQLKKRPTSSEFVEDSSSSNDAVAAVVAALSKPPSPKKKKLFTSNAERLLERFESPPPKINASPPKPNPVPSASTAILQRPRPPSPTKKKKKKQESDSESDSDTSSEDRSHKKKKKKHAHVEPEPPKVQVRATAMSSDSEDEDEEEEDENPASSGYRQGQGRLPPFPKENYECGHEKAGSSSSGSSEDEEGDSSSSSSSTDLTKSLGNKKTTGATAAVAAGPPRTSKEYRDQQIEKHQKRISGR